MSGRGRGLTVIHVDLELKMLHPNGGKLLLEAPLLVNKGPVAIGNLYNAGGFRRGELYIRRGVLLREGVPEVCEQVTDAINGFVAVVNSCSIINIVDVGRKKGCCLGGRVWR